MHNVEFTPHFRQLRDELLKSHIAQQVIAGKTSKNLVRGLGQLWTRWVISMTGLHHELVSRSRTLLPRPFINILEKVAMDGFEMLIIKIPL